MFDFIKYLQRNRLTLTDRMADRAKNSISGKKLVKEEYNPEVPDADQRIGSSDKTASRVGGNQSKLADLKRKKDELVKKFTSGLIDIQQYKQMIGNIPQQIKALQAALDKETMAIGDSEEDSLYEDGVNELEVEPESDLGQSVMKLAKINEQIEKLTVEMKKLESQHKELEGPIYEILQDLSTLEQDIDKSIKVGNQLIVSFKTKPTQITNYKYKEAFTYLEGKVNGALQKLVNEIKEAHKSVSTRKGSVSVTKLNEDESLATRLNSAASKFSDDVDSIHNIVAKLTGGKTM
jgi:predicted  nucleic acid-binding Zn-ribbon protein